MKLIIFQGGLGNQLFEYAFYQKISQKHKNVFYIFRGIGHNGFELDKYFHTNLIKAPLFINLFFRIIDFLQKKTKWNFFTTESHFLKTGEGIILDGYWQEKRFLSKLNISFKDLNIGEKNQKIKSAIESSNSVSIHIRRGDYLLPQFINIYGGICTIEYYNKAIEICKEKIPNPHFFIFSDDIEWCKKNLHIADAIYIDWNKGNDSVFDMYLMSYAKANIIANSTFSFWGAKLNKQNQLTIYPKKWFKSKFTAPDIFPNEWIGI